MTRILALLLSVVLIMRDKGCAPSWRTYQIQFVSLNIRGFPPNEVQDDCWVVGILVQLGLYWWPSIPTFCCKDEFHYSKPVTHSRGRSTPSAAFSCISTWLRELTCLAMNWHPHYCRKWGTVGREGQKSYVQTEALSWRCMCSLQIYEPGSEWGTPGETSVPYKEDLTTFL